MKDLQAFVGVVSQDTATVNGHDVQLRPGKLMVNGLEFATYVSLS